MHNRQAQGVGTHVLQLSAGLAAAQAVAAGVIRLQVAGRKRRHARAPQMAAAVDLEHSLRAGVVAALAGRLTAGM